MMAVFERPPTTQQKALSVSLFYDVYLLFFISVAFYFEKFQIKQKLKNI